MRRVPEARHLRLRRRLDAGVPWQAAEVWVDGSLVARLPPIDVNPYRRWRELDLDLPEVTGKAATRDLEITVVATTNPDGQPDDVTYTAFLWELWTDVDPTLFANGFEAGNTEAWSHTVD
jgi:hypothetical protein